MYPSSHCREGSSCNHSKVSLQELKEKSGDLLSTTLNVNIRFVCLHEDSTQHL